MKLEYAKKIIHQLSSDYDTISDQFDQTRQHNWQEISDAIQKYVSNDSKILDIGCGNGRLLQNIPENVDYTGLDISQNLITKAQTNHSDRTFVVGNILELPFEDNIFDVIFAIASLHHIPSDQLRQNAINEIKRVLKPNGILIMTNWNLNQPKYMQYHNTNHQIDKNMDENDTIIPWKNPQGEILAQRYYHAFTLEEINNLLSEFEIIDNEKSKHNLITIAKK